MSLHKRTVHPGPDILGCFACRIGDGPAVHGDTPMRQAFKADAADMDAYARLRADGVQPPRVGGSALLEARADTVNQVEHGPAMGRALDAAVKVGAI